MAFEAINTGFGIQIIRDLEELETLRDAWSSWKGSRESDFDSFSSRIRSRGIGCQPYVIAVISRGKPNAILIGLCEHRIVPFKVGPVQIYQTEANVLEFLYGGLRGEASQDNCAALVREVMRALGDGEADLARWEHLDVHSPLYRCALKLPSFTSRDHSHLLERHWLRYFPAGMDSFLMGLGRSQRSKLRRKYHKFHKHFEGSLEIRCFRSTTEIERAILDMEEIARKTDKRRVFGIGFFDNAQTRAEMAMAAKKGWLRIYILYLENRPATFWMGTLYDGCLHADQVGYDPAWRNFSPGIVLFLHILEDLRDEDIKTVDFGWGDIQFRRCFSDQQCIESRVHIYAPTLRGIQLNVLDTLSCRATACAGFLLGRTRLRHVRRLLRRRLTWNQNMGIPDKVAGASADEQRRVAT